jgi:hypothetical protein
MLTCAVVAVTAESLGEQPPHCCQVRTTDHRINEAVELGLRESLTFRQLVNRINVSDIVVYVIADASTTLPLGIDGRLTFLSSTAGYRYVVVRVNSNLSRLRLVSLLGHELQHAREIADSDAIVDPVSLAREYGAGIGYHSRGRHEQQTFDSRAAIRVGEQVLREVLGD